MSHAGLPITQKVINDTIGARLLGALLSLILTSAIFSEGFRYFRAFGGTDGDARWLQMLVGSVILLATAHSVALVQSTIQVHVQHFLDPSIIATLPISVAITGYTSGMIAALVQAYFARRSWLLIKKSMPYAVIMGILISFVFAASFVYPSINLALNASFSTAHVAAIQGVFAAWLTTCLAVDTTICVVMFSRLSKLKKETNFTGTDSVIVQLLVYSITTCFLTSILIIVTTILYFAFPQTQLFFITYQPIAKVYAISLLMQLATRAPIKTGAATTMRKSQLNARSQISMQEDRFEISLARESMASPEPTPEAGTKRLSFVQSMYNQDLVDTVPSIHQHP